MRSCTRSPGKPPVWAWPLYVIALVLAMYMTFVAVLVVPAQLASLFWCRRRFRLVARGLAIAAICSLPLVVLARERGAGQLFWIPRPSFSEAAAPIEQILGSGLPPQFHLTATSLPLLGLTVALLVLIGVAALMGDRAHSAVDNVSRERWAAALVVSWLLVPGLVDTVESFVGQSVFESRYLLVSAPAASLALSCGLCSSRWALSPAVRTDPAELRRVAGELARRGGLRARQRTTWRLHRLLPGGWSWRVRLLLRRLWSTCWAAAAPGAP